MLSGRFSKNTTCDVVPFVLHLCHHVDMHKTLKHYLLGLLFCSLGALPAHAYQIDEGDVISTRVNKLSEVNNTLDLLYIYENNTDTRLIDRNVILFALAKIFPVEPAELDVDKWLSEFVSWTDNDMWNTSLAARKFNRIGIAYIRLNDYHAAIRSFQRSLKAQRGYKYAMDNLATTIYKQIQAKTDLQMKLQEISRTRTANSVTLNFGGSMKQPIELKIKERLNKTTVQPYPSQQVSIYALTVERRIKAEWSKMQSTNNKDIVVLLEIASDGSILSSSIHTSCGSAEVDQRALQTIRACAPFPIPPKLPGNMTVDLQFTFPGKGN